MGTRGVALDCVALASASMPVCRVQHAPAPVLQKIPSDEDKSVLGEPARPDILLRRTYETKRRGVAPSRSIRVESKHRNQRKMIGSRSGKNSHLADGKMVGVENIIERIPKTR